MNVKMLKRVRELWNTGERQLDRHNQRAWVRAVKRLGERWLLAKHVERRA
jgi:hypothetical protein